MEAADSTAAGEAVSSSFGRIVVVVQVAEATAKVDVEIEVGLECENIAETAFDSEAAVETSDIVHFGMAAL